ncbi:hypothetical protein KKG71_02360 [Patescibacteria group bacterium]|nr:hypothetical protein [Patescibacteria group bacterium]
MQKKFTIQISEPWNFTTKDNTNILTASLIRELKYTSHYNEPEAAIFKLDKPFKYEGILIKYLLAQARYEKENIRKFLEKKTFKKNFMINILSITEESIHKVTKESLINSKIFIGSLKKT